jgi:hypothetical protein
MTFVYVLFASSSAAADHAPDGEQAPAEPAPSGAAASAIRGQELMINAFRAPSIGLEYRIGLFSLHAGLYPTVIGDGSEVDTTWFAKAGLNVWFLPIHMLGNERSSFYAGASYLRELGDDGWDHAAQVEAGFRLVAFEGLFVRAGASALYAPGRTCPSGDDCKTIKFRPNGAIGWAFAID